MIKSVEKALAILDYVADSARAPVRLKEIASDLGIDAGTCAHIINTLCTRHYMERVSRFKGYTIGPQAYYITNMRVYKEELLRVASPFMMRLCQELCENVSISTYLQGVLYVPYTICFNETRLRHRRSERGKLYMSASGRVILAYMDKRELNDALNKVGYPSEEEWSGVGDAKALAHELKQIRASGTCAASYVHDELAAVACPIFENGRVRAAMGAYMDYRKFKGEVAQRAIYMTQQAAYNINKRLEALNAQ